MTTLAKVTTPISTEWVSGMGWLKNITGALLTLCVIVLVAALIVFALRIGFSRVASNRAITGSLPAPSTLLTIVLAATALGSLSAIVTWSGQTFGEEMATVDVVAVGAPTKSEKCQAAVNLYAASSDGSLIHAWAYTAWETNKCAGVSTVQGTVPPYKPAPPARPGTQKAV